MNVSDLEKSLINWTVQNSGYDEHRSYIGLSGIADCSLLIYRRFFNHTGASMESQLKTRYSYELEKNIQERFKGLNVYSPGKEISLYDGLVKGHTDGEILNNLLEIKTVPLFEHIPRSAREISRKIFLQCQAYMMYGNYEQAVVIYFARDQGLFRIFILDRHRGTGDNIASKLDALVEFVRMEMPPPCDCGRCK
jgi:hypothetical protein